MDSCVPAALSGLGDEVLRDRDRSLSFHGNGARAFRVEGTNTHRVTSIYISHSAIRARYHYQIK